MENHLDRMFKELKKNKKTAVIPFLPAGWPELDSTEKIVSAAVRGGATAVELGWAFSDPLGDGPVNQVAYDRAIENGSNGTSILRAAAAIRSNHNHLPIIVMGYANPLLSYGVEKWAADAEAAGVDGLICVDLPPQEAIEISRILKRSNIHPIFLLAPTSTDERISLIAEHGTGMIYCVSVVGITGARRALSSELPDFIKRVKEKTNTPLAVGFGISEPEHVASVGNIAEAAVVGSAFVGAISSAQGNDHESAAEKFISRLVNGG